MTTKKILFHLILIIFSAIFLSACQNPNTSKPPTPTAAPQLTHFTSDQLPLLSLIPRTDGHELKLKIEKIPNNIDQIEYELIYSASDKGLEIEKGVGDTIKSVSASLERHLLFFTSSCTNGCKYKYDYGVTGGTLSLTFTTIQNQIITFQTPFSLKTGRQIKLTDGKISLPTESYSQAVSAIRPTAFYLLIKNFADSSYSLFSSASF